MVEDFGEFEDFLENFDKSSEIDKLKCFDNKFGEQRFCVVKNSTGKDSHLLSLFDKGDTLSILVDRDYPAFALNKKQLKEVLKI